MKTELWGRRLVSGTGNGKPSTSEIAVKEANPFQESEVVTWTEYKVGKPEKGLPRKSAIVFHKPVP